MQVRAAPALPCQHASHMQRCQDVELVLVSGSTGVAIGYAGAFRYFFAEYFFRQGQIHQNDWDDQRSGRWMAPAEALCWLAVNA